MIKTMPAYSLFVGDKLIRAGDAASVWQAALKEKGEQLLWIFDNQTGHTVEWSEHFPLEKIEAIWFAQKPAHLKPEPVVEVSTITPPTGKPGRPKLGVVAREVTLLPRHWEWLSKQTGGASVALRKLVEAAKLANTQIEKKREAQDVCYAFMQTMAGDYEGFEEALRALYAGDKQAFEAHTSSWPIDIKVHAYLLSYAVWN